MRVEPALARTASLMVPRRVGASAQPTIALPRVQRRAAPTDQRVIIDAAEPGKPRRPPGYGAPEALERARSEPAADLHACLESLTRGPSGSRIPPARADGTNEIEWDRTRTDEFGPPSTCNVAWVSLFWWPL